MDDRQLYFAYGSNLDPVQMKRRCPGSDAVGRAFAFGYALTFPVHSTGDWQGGVASIESYLGTIHGDQDLPPAWLDEPHVYFDHGMWGVLYRVTEDDLLALDRYEAVDEGMYERGKIQVLIPPRRSVDSVITYGAVRGYNAPQPPSKKYRDTIADGAAHHGLPEDYVASIRAIRTND